MEAVHEGMVADPGAEETCGLRHAKQTEAQPVSLHYNLQGHKMVLANRSSEEIGLSRWLPTTTTVAAVMQRAGSVTSVGQPAYVLVRHVPIE